MKDDLYTDLQAVVDAEDTTQSQLVREGIRRALTHRDSADVGDVVDRLEAQVDALERQTTRLERLPLE